MNGFVDKTKAYYNATINTMDNVLLNYNYGVLAMLNYGNENAGYNTGTFNTTTTSIYGKPLKTETYINEAFSQLEKYINDDELPIFSQLNIPTITSAQKRLFKKNYNNYLNNGYKAGFPSDIFTTISTLVQAEQDFVYNVDRLNFVTQGSTTGTDGKINSKGIAQIFVTTGTTELVNGASINTLTSLRNDYTTLATDTNNFLTSLTTTGIFVPTAYNPKSPGSFTSPASFGGELSNSQQQTEYMLMSKALSKNNREGFLTELLKGLDKSTQDIVRKYYGDTLPTRYDKLNSAGKQLVSNYRTSPDGKKYLDYTPSFGTTQKRITLASEDTNASNDVKKTLQNIYSGKNDSNKTNPYNFKSKFN